MKDKKNLILIIAAVVAVVAAVAAVIAFREQICAFFSPKESGDDADASGSEFTPEEVEDFADI